MSSSPILKIHPIGFQFPVRDPFLFCAWHEDHYPPGNENLGPAAPLTGRNIGEDFTIRDGWRMYHGRNVPGFPAHPHRGFETVTVVNRGFVDHSDSHGSEGRYGEGDVQWMTAGSGLQHCEMFPLLNRTEPNPAELFQIWLNLPGKKKMSRPFYKMLWSEQIPVVSATDSSGKKSEIKVIAGSFNGVIPPTSAPDSWASDPENQVAVWLIRIEPGAVFDLPAARTGLTRFLYFYRGESLTVAGQKLRSGTAAELVSDAESEWVNGPVPSEILVLQGKPIGEPVAQYGPFVMNTHEEIYQAFSDYRKTEFGGWPFPEYEKVHSRDAGRFARYAGDREAELPGGVKNPAG